MFPHIIDYSLCQDTVTIYHQEGGNVTRTVHSGVMFDWKQTQNIEKTGSKEVNGFFLLMPGDTQQVFPGDKVVRGEGEEVGQDVARWWARFIPAKVPNMGVVDHVDPKYWNGKMVHVEAGG